MIRPAVGQDAPAIATLQARSWQRAYAGIFPAELLSGIPIAAWTRAWRRRIAASLERGLTVEVVEAGEAVIGFCCAGSGELDVGDPDTGELHTLYVDPAHWRLGAGRRLIASAADGLRVRGYQSAAAWVVTQNELARRFYESVGWRWDGATMVGDLWEVNGRMARYDAVRYRIDLSPPPR